MHLGEFLAASYALLVEEHQRINPFKDFLSLSQEIAPEPEKPRVETEAVQNNDSLAQFNAMMSGVQKRR